MIPFVFTVPGGHVTVGQKFVIKGEPPHHSNRFNIDLVQGATQQAIFHLDFRFDQGQTVRNTNFPNGQWSKQSIYLFVLNKIIINWA